MKTKACCHILTNDRLWYKLQKGILFLGKALFLVVVFLSGYYQNTNLVQVFFPHLCIKIFQSEVSLLKKKRREGFETLDILENKYKKLLLFCLLWGSFKQLTSSDKSKITTPLFFFCSQLPLLPFSNYQAVALQEIQWKDRREKWEGIGKEEHVNNGKCWYWGWGCFEILR